MPFQHFHASIKYVDSIRKGSAICVPNYDRLDSVIEKYSRALEEV